MRFPLSRWSCLTVAGLSAGLIVAGNNLSQAWQNPGQPNRPRSNAASGADETEPAEQVTREPGAVTLPKCSVKLLDSVVLATDRPGLIAFVEPKEGDLVRKDQEIVFLKDESAVALFNVTKQKAENDVNKRFAEKSAAVAKAEWERMLESNRKVPGSIPATEIERAKLNFEKGLLQKEQAEHEQVVARLEMEKAAAELKTYKIEAPFDGEVRKVLKHKGEAVTQGTPILELISTRSVRVEGYLPIEDYSNVRKGDRVEVRLDIPDKDLEIEKEVFEGKVYFIDKTVSLVTHGARVWAEVDNPGGHLIEGLYAKMTIRHGRDGNSTVKKPATKVGATGIRPASGTK
ncbi:MAG: efflux RND transporter periplasmic adaptor subunit [Planctomycetaceae bacterium]